MIQDKQLLCSDDQSLAAAAGTVVSTDKIDLAAVGTAAIGGPLLHDAFRGNPPEVFAQITEAVVASGGAATIDIRLVQSANADLSSPDILASTGAIAKATLIAGYRATFRVPTKITKRYLGFNYVIATATVDSGTITAGLQYEVPDAPGNTV